MNQFQLKVLERKLVQSDDIVRVFIEDIDGDGEFLIDVIYKHKGETFITSYDARAIEDISVDSIFDSIIKRIELDRMYFDTNFFENYLKDFSEDDYDFLWNCIHWQLRLFIIVKNSEVGEKQSINPHLLREDFDRLCVTKDTMLDVFVEIKNIYQF